MLEYELLIFCREGEARSYHGFREMVALLLPELLAEFAVPETTSGAAFISNAAHVGSHFCHLLGRAARGELRLTQAGDLHRKSLQDLARAFASGAGLSAAASEDEAVFLFRFAADAGLLLEDEGVLRPAPLAAVWLDEGRIEWMERLREWWLRRRLGGMSRTLKFLADKAGADGAYGVSSLAPLLSVFMGWDRAQAKPADSSTWENLPLTLRELWILGGVDFALSKGRIRWGRLLSEAKVSGGDASAEPARGLPNFEALIPVSAPLHRQFQVEVLARRDNDEMLARFRFTKESVVQGLQAGITADSLQELAAWLGFEAPARRALEDWAAAYVAAVFREIFVLCVRDAGRFAELTDFPQFMELVTEVIPGYGFVLPRAAKEPARELLRVFDLVPGEESALPRALQPVAAPASDSGWALPVVAQGEIVYRHAPPLRRELPSLGERGARSRVEETLSQRIQILEGAIRLGKTVEFAYNGNGVGRVQAQPLHVLRNRDPVKLIAVEAGSGHRNEYLLDQVQGLRVLDPE
jgi:hypothetical protein